MSTSTIDLVGHRKKVGIIKWHPTAENVLASAGKIFFNFLFIQIRLNALNVSHNWAPFEISLEIFLHVRLSF